MPLLGHTSTGCASGTRAIVTASTAGCAEPAAKPRPARAHLERVVGQWPVRDLQALPPFFRFSRSGKARVYDEFTHQYTAHGFHTKTKAAAPDPLHVFAQIGTGRGCTCLPAPFALHRYAGVQPRPLRERIVVPLVLLTSSRATQELHDALVRSARRMLGAE